MSQVKPVKGWVTFKLNIENYAVQALWKVPQQKVKEWLV